MKRSRWGSLKLFCLIWWSRLTHWHTFMSWVGLQRPLAYWGILWLERLVGDSELILQMQALQYREASVKLRKAGDPESLLVAGIYEGVGDMLERAAFDVYASFK